ncbi:ECF transporter S component [Chengkuizengella sediminis]|uniref:ECF transporter S component n=1 Tax=Chengkuizengella sediminis TaxID=1885917 RepID=UPI001389EA62|nr:ECF transporter S component [Chengkuizengella sediminis]NDI35085.1 thiamine ABC transporter permease [Chengkuizengella sediminis]
MSSKGLKLTDILVTIVIAVVFGIVYRVWGSVYDFFALPGLHLEQLSYGMWYIAATVAFLIIRKPGVAIIAEMAAATAEMVMASQYGVDTLIYGFVQGLAVELVLLATLYKRSGLIVMSIAGAAAAASSFIIDYFKGYLADLTAWNLTLQIVLRVISGIIITGVFAYYLVKALERTGITNLVRPASKEDYDALDK